MKFKIDPFVGVNEFKFGATQAEVEAVAGAPESVEDDDIMETVEETRPGLVLIYVEGNLADIRIESDQVSIQGVEVHEAGAVDKLKALSKVKTGKGDYVLFTDLGLCLRGFTKKSQDGKVLEAFAKNRLEYYGFVLEV